MLCYVQWRNKGPRWPRSAGGGGGGGGAILGGAKSLFEYGTILKT